jgi:hypothetical protein
MFFVVGKFGKLKYRRPSTIILLAFLDKSFHGQNLLDLKK